MSMPEHIRKAAWKVFMAGYLDEPVGKCGNCGAELVVTEPGTGKYCGDECGGNALLKIEDDMLRAEGIEPYTYKRITPVKAIT